MSAAWPGSSPTLLSRFGAWALRRRGWTPLLAAPTPPRFVAAVAPHTDNADFWIGLLWKWATRSPAHFIAKREIFVFPVGLFMRAVGGLPIDRRRVGGNFVDAVVALIEREPEIMLTVAPEGTRRHTEFWKTGFYYMALEAQVPIGVTVLDWGRRQVGVVGYVTPTGDLEADFAVIRRLLEGVRGHTPANAGPVRPRPAAQGGPGRG